MWNIDLNSKFIMKVLLCSDYVYDNSQKARMNPMTANVIMVTLVIRLPENVEVPT